MNTPLTIKNAPQSGKSVKRLLRQSVRAVRTNQFKDAIKYIDEVLERQPENERANALKFTTFYMSKQLEKARKVGTKAASLNPNSDYILNNQACLELGVGNSKEAEELLEQLIDNKGENAQWLYNLGLAKAQLGKFLPAIDTFNRVLDLQPDHHKAILQKASVELKLGEHELAMQSFNTLRLIAPSQSAAIASHIYHGIRFNQFDLQSLKQEISIWGDYFIPKNKSYENPAIDKTKALKIGFIVGSTLPKEWKFIVRPVINKIAKAGHKITVFWHQFGTLPISQSNSIELINCRQKTDADFARLCREKGCDVLIDVGGMHSQTRERALGLKLASKQYAWLVHAGIFSSAHISSLEEKLGSYQFAINLPVSDKQSNIEKNTIAAIGCQSGLSINTIRIWSNILKKSKKNLVLDVKQKPIQDHLLKRFEQFSISNERLSFASDFQFKSGQLVLDNIDYNDLPTSCSALKAGATVITLTGELFPAKRTSALLQQLGFNDCVCEGEEQYSELAVKYANSSKKNSGDIKAFSDNYLDDTTKFAQHFIDAL